MKILKVEPNSETFEAVEIENDLTAMQKVIDGYIEVVTLNDNLLLIVDEEGVLKDKPLNIVGNYPFRGTVVLVGYENEEFADCPLDEDIANAFLLN